MFSGASGDGVKSEGRRLKASGLEEERLKKGKTCRGYDNDKALHQTHVSRHSVQVMFNTN